MFFMPYDVTRPQQVKQYDAKQLRYEVWFCKRMKNVIEWFSMGSICEDEECNGCQRVNEEHHPLCCLWYPPGGNTSGSDALGDWGTHPQAVTTDSPNKQYAF